MKICRLLTAALLLLTVCTACGRTGAQNAASPTTTAATAATAAPTTAATAPPSVGWITADSLRVRKGAGLSFEVIGGLAEGDRVQITGKSGDWYSIAFGDTTGFISAQYVTFTEHVPGSETTGANTGATVGKTTATTAS